MSDTMILAEQAASFGYCEKVLSPSYKEGIQTHVPAPGWRAIGRGHSRTCYLGPDGFVYKVQKRHSYLGNINLCEWEKYREISSQQIPEGFGIPTMELIETSYGTVIVCEYIDGPHPSPDNENDYYNVGSTLGIHDCGYFNLVVRDNILYFVDIAA